MNQIIIDLEFNQPFKIDPLTHNLLKAELIDGIKHEVLEIGAIKLNNNLEIIDTFQELIKPQIYTQINPIVKRITKIKEKQLHSALGFKNTIKRFKKWLELEDDYIIYAWGKDDFSALVENCKYHKIDYSWLHDFIDLQELCSLYLQYKEKQISLKKAMEVFQITEKARPHRALVDSWHSAEVLQKIG